MATRQPTIGRIVHFNYQGKTVPAMVVEVDESQEAITLCVFTPVSIANYHNVQHGPDESQWHWPELQKE